LAIVYAIARAHGGNVRATASASGGAAFELDLPEVIPRSKPVAARLPMTSSHR
jgi:hypothetical protein